MLTTIEAATLTDADALLQAQIRAFHNDAVIYPGVELGGPPGYDSVTTVREAIQHQQTEVYKIVYQEQIVGGIVVFVKGKQHYHLDLLYIDPEYHNRGIGSQAIQFLEQTYHARKWTLDTPLYAVRNHHFYEKFGFVKVSQRDVPEDNITLIEYEKLYP